MANAQVNNVVQFGGTGSDSHLTIPTSNPNGYFALYAQTTATTASPFYKNGVIYQVPGGLKCKVVQATLIPQTANDRALLLSATTTFAAGDAFGTLVGPKYQTGDSARYAYSSVTAYTPANYAFPYEFAASTFPGVGASSGNCQIILLCKEEA